MPPTRRPGRAGPARQTTPNRRRHRQARWLRRRPLRHRRGRRRSSRSRRRRSRPAPLRPQQGREGIFDRLDTVLEGGGAALAPVLRERVLGRRLHARRRPRATTSARTTTSTCAAATRSRATSASRPSSSRRGCSTAAAQLSVLGGWREATQVGFYGIGIGHVDGRPHELSVQAAVRVGALHDLPDAPRPDAARRRRAHASGRRSPARGRSRRSRRSTRLRRCPAWARKSPTCTRRARSGSTGARRPATRAAAASTASTLHDYNDRTTSSASRWSTTRRFSTFRSCAKPGCSRSAAACRHAIEKDGQQIPFFMLPSLGGGSTLRGYSSWRFRDQNSLLLQAEWRIMVNRFSTLAFFYDAGKVAARTADLDFDGLKDDFGFGVRFHGPFVDAAARRAGQEPRRPARSSSRRPPPSEVTCHVHINVLVTRTPRRPPGAVGRRARRCSPPASRRRARASIPTIRSRASRNRRTPRRRQPYDQSQMYEMIVQPVRHVRLQADRPAREEHQHDRRGARLELVHQPHRHQGDHDRRARARPECRRAARPVELGADQGEDRRRASGLHGEGRQGRDLVPRVRSAVVPGRRDRGRRGRDEDLLGARLQPGGIVPDDLRSEERRRSTRRPRSAARTASARRSRNDDINAILERVARNAGRHLPRHRRPPAARQDSRRLPVRRHAPRRSQRPRAARAPPRAARAARLRRVDEPHRPQGREHARHARHGERQDRSSSTTCRTSARRSACATTSTSGTSATSTSTRATPSRKRLFTLGFGLSPWQTVDYVEYPSVGKFEGEVVRSAESGGRRRRRRPTWSCATTTRSGRRGGSRPSPTS